MSLVEQLGSFYLGKEYDLKAGRRSIGRSTMTRAIWSLTPSVSAWPAAAGNIEQLHVPARKSDITVHLVSPAWQLTYQDVDGHAGLLTVPVYPGATAGEPSAW